MSFKETRVDLATIVFDQIAGLHKQCDATMRGRIDATIHGTYFAKKLDESEFLALRNLTLGFIFRSLKENIASLAAKGVDTTVMFAWLPATAEEFITQLEAEYAPPSEEPEP